MSPLLCDTGTKRQLAHYLTVTNQWIHLFYSNECVQFNSPCETNQNTCCPSSQSIRVEMQAGTLALMYKKKKKLQRIPFDFIAYIPLQLPIFYHFYQLPFTVQIKVWAEGRCYVLYTRANEAISNPKPHFLIHVTLALGLWTHADISDGRRFSVLDVTEKWLILLIW